MGEDKYRPTGCDHDWHDYYPVKNTCTMQNHASMSVETRHVLALIDSGILTDEEGGLILLKIARKYL